jgi:LmbE family N-acetylglucosaminyl deacetylase
VRIGVPSEDRVFLGYPDTGLRSLWEFDWDADRPHLARNGATEVPYPFAFRPGAPYCGASVAEDLEHLIADYQPTAIVYPDPNDQHPDHRAAAAFVEYALRDLGYRCRRFTYLAHYGHYPLPWAYLPRQYLRPPTELRETGTDWVSLPLTPGAESEKLAAVLCYRSQVRLPHMNVYLRSFVRRNELFGTYTPLHPLRIENDAEPPSSPDAQDVVVREPAAPSVPEILRRGSAPSGVRMALGPTMLWAGVTVPGAGAAGTDVAIHLRLLGGRAAARLDALVSGGTVRLSHAYSESVSPGTAIVRRTGDTVWVGVPATLVEGHDAVLASGEAVLSGGRTAGTAWRPVLLR